MTTLPHGVRVRSTAWPRRRAVQVKGRFRQPVSGLDFLLFGVVPLAPGPIPPFERSEPAVGRVSIATPQQPTDPGRSSL